MKNLPCLRAFLVALAAPLLLSSCALPAPDAWRVIRSEGFFSYLSIEMGRKPIPAGLSVSPRPAMLAQQQPMISVPWRAAPNRYWDSNPSKPVATTPQVTAPAPAIAIAPKPVLRTLPPKPTVASTPAPVVKPTPAAVEKPEVKAEPTPKVVTTPLAPAADKPKPAPKKPEVTTTPAPAPTPPAVATAINELPYGTVIAGRPGFVHSPFAMKTQIVDVTGLRAGQEVKCPFTGKLFRVPPGEQASAKPVEEKK